MEENNVDTSVEQQNPTPTIDKVNKFEDILVEK